MHKEHHHVPTRGELKKIISYDPATGQFTRLIATSSQGPAGLIKGSIRRATSGKAYYCFKVLSQSHFAHRLAFILMVGSPPEQVDHKNGNGLDNRWSNLRASVNDRNAKNQRLRISNTSGQMGVSWHRKSNQWAIRINAHGRRINLGYRKDFQEAVAVRKAAELEYGYDSNHGEVRPLFSGRDDAAVTNGLRQKPGVSHA